MVDISRLTAIETDGERTRIVFDGGSFDLPNDMAVALAKALSKHVTGFLEAGRIYAPVVQTIRVLPDNAGSTLVFEYAGGLLAPDAIHLTPDQTGELRERLEGPLGRGSESVRN